MAAQEFQEPSYSQEVIRVFLGSLARTIADIDALPLEDRNAASFLDCLDGRVEDARQDADREAAASNERSLYLLLRWIRNAVEGHKTS